MGSRVESDDREIVARLRAGDERAFRSLVEQYNGRLARLARSFCRSSSVVDEAVQETWLAVVQGISRFEGRGSLQSWMFSILVNTARKMAVREKRHLDIGKEPQASVIEFDDPHEEDPPEPGMGANGMWERPPASWGLEDPEAVFLRDETLRVIEAALDAMPESQRQVVLLRDVEGFGSEEVCNILSITDTNERVLLHRGRTRVRRALDAYLSDRRTEPQHPIKSRPK